MAERKQKPNEAQPIEIEQIVARAVSQALQDQLPQLQEQIAQRVLEALPAPVSEVPGIAREGSSTLVQAVSSYPCRVNSEGSLASSVGLWKRTLLSHRTIRSESRSGVRMASSRLRR
jgi:hypothetical protein